jgi:hypothetical protein
VTAVFVTDRIRTVDFVTKPTPSGLARTKACAAKVKADLERELQTWSLNCSKRGLDVHWVGGLGITHLATGRTRAGAERRAAVESTNGGSPPARGRGGRSSDVAETDVVPAPYSGQTD